MFRPTQYPDVFEDDNGQMWPLDPVTITQLRNNGQIAGDSLGPSGGGGGMGVSQQPRLKGIPFEFGGAGYVPTEQPTAPPVKQQRVLQDNFGDFRGPQANMAPAQPVKLQGLPQDVGGAPPLPQSGPPQLQRVAPRQRQQQQGPGQQERILQRVGSTPEAWVPTARQSSGISEEQQDDLQQRVIRSAQNQMDVNDALAREQQEILLNRSERIREDTLNNAMKNSVVQSELDKKNSWIQSQQEKVQQRLKEVRESKVDAGRVWEGTDGAMAGLLAVLGSALGGYASTMNGGPNQAMQMINNMIDRDIEEQRTNIANASNAAADERDYFERYVARSADEEKAMLRSIELEKVRLRTEEILNKEELKILWPLARQTNAEVDKQLNSELLTVNQAISRTAGERFQPAQRGGVIDVTEKVLARDAKISGYRKTIAENERAITGADDAADPNAVMVDGQVVGKSPEAKEINAQIRAYNTLKQNAQIATKMIREGSVLDDARYEALVNDAMFDLAGAKGTTIRSDTDVKQFGDMLGGTDRAKIRKENQIKIWNDAVRRGGNAARLRMKQSGLPTDAIEQDDILPTE